MQAKKHISVPRSQSHRKEVESEMARRCGPRPLPPPPPAKSWKSKQSNLVNTDTEGAIESARINKVDVRVLL